MSLLPKIASAAAVAVAGSGVFLGAALGWRSDQPDLLSFESGSRLLAGYAVPAPRPLFGPLFSTQVQSFETLGWTSRSIDPVTLPTLIVASDAETARVDPPPDVDEVVAADVVQAATALEVVVPAIGQNSTIPSNSLAETPAPSTAEERLPTAVPATPTSSVPHPEPTTGATTQAPVRPLEPTATRPHQPTRSPVQPVEPTATRPSQPTRPPVSPVEPTATLSAPGPKGEKEKRETATAVATAVAPTPTAHRHEAPLETAVAPAQAVEKSVPVVSDPPPAATQVTKDRPTTPVVVTTPETVVPPVATATPDQPRETKKNSERAQPGPDQKKTTPTVEPPPNGPQATPISVAPTPGRTKDSEHGPKSAADIPTSSNEKRASEAKPDTTASDDEPRKDETPVDGATIRTTSEKRSESETDSPTASSAPKKSGEARRGK